MRVRAKQIENKKYVGYYNLVRRRPGDVFDLLDEKDFSKKWMEKVDGDTPKTVAPGEPRPEDLKADGHLGRETEALSQISKRGRPRRIEA